MSAMARNALLIGILLIAAAVAAVGQVQRNPSREERDVAQERLDQAGAPLSPGHTVAQTFVSGHAGLKRVEFLLVSYDPTRELPSGGQLVFTLERQDDSASPPVRVTLSTTGLKHNQRVTFSFAPLATSRDAHYRLTLTSGGDYGLGFWHTSSDSYAYGEMLVDGVPAAGDLYFATTYDYHLTDIWPDLVAIARRYGGAVPGLLLLLCLPGLVLTLWLPTSRRLDAGTYAALVVSLSVAFWPLLLLWASTAGQTLTPGAAWAVVAGLALAAGVYAWLSRRSFEPDASHTGGDPLPGIALCVVFLATLTARLLAIRDLVVPAWVDSVHHTLLSQLIIETGRVPESLMPYLPVSDFHYHFGFHANVAVLSWLSGLAAPQAVLLLGQVLNAATVLTVYALANELTGRRWSGVAAALVAGAWSIMPAYYVTWGRYTQLSGLLMLPVLSLVTVWLFDPRRRTTAVLALGAILAAGLALVHYRVLVFYALFCLCYAPLAAWPRRSGRGEWLALTRSMALLGGLSLLLASPWAFRFLVRVIPQVSQTYGGWSISGEYSAFPTGLFSAGWVRSIQGAAVAGAAWALLRGKGRLIVVAVWVAAWLLLANLHVLGLRDIWLINNESVFIALWLPESLFVGWLVGDAIYLLGRVLPRALGYLPWQRVISMMLLGAATALACRGGWGMVDVINPVTVIATSEDLQAIAWAVGNTPPDARFLINTRPWQGDLYVGSDGGWWLPILGKRAVSLPCLLYGQGTPGYRREIVDLARAVGEAKSLDDPELHARLLREGITHVFVGASGGRLLPKDLDASSLYRLRYSLGGVRIYEVVSSVSSSGAGT